MPTTRSFSSLLWLEIIQLLTFEILYVTTYTYFIHDQPFNHCNNHWVTSLILWRCLKACDAVHPCEKSKWFKLSAEQTHYHLAKHLKRKRQQRWVVLLRTSQRSGWQSLPITRSSFSFSKSKSNHPHIYEWQLNWYKYFEGVQAHVWRDRGLPLLLPHRDRIHCPCSQVPRKWKS